jgi:ATP-binding cassette subfamily B protein
MFVRQPELLVFDDLSSALDVETENKLWERLRQTSGVTCIAVAHRPAAFEHADQIIILEHGRVVARGTPKELMENSEEMRQLYQRPSEEAVA